MVAGSMNCVKYLMFFFNFLFWLSGLILIIIGALVRDKYGDYISMAEHEFANAAVLIIVVGAVVFVIGFLGCCGAVRENYCMVTTFAVLMAVIFILEIVAGALGLSYKSKVNAVATDALNKALDQYDTKAGANQLIDWAQTTFECCGVNGVADWEGKGSANKTNFCATPKTHGVKSCHKEKDCAKKEYTSGCKPKFIELIKSNLMLVGGFAMGIAFIQLLGIVFACLMMRAIKGEYEVV